MHGLQIATSQQQGECTKESFEEREGAAAVKSRAYQAGGWPREQRAPWSNPAHQGRLRDGGWASPGEAKAYGHCPELLHSPVDSEDRA